MKTITVNASGFVLSGPLVAGEPVAVSVSGVDFAEGPRPCVTIRARFPNALLASADLTFDENAGAWTGTLYSATRQTVLAFLTARADEARPVTLELIDAEHSESVARVSVLMVNSSLLPTDNPPGAHRPEYLGVPGEKGDKGDDGGSALSFVDDSVVPITDAAATVQFRAGEFRAIRFDAGDSQPVATISYTVADWPEDRADAALRSVVYIINSQDTALKVVTRQGAYTMPTGKAALCEAWCVRSGTNTPALVVSRVAPLS